MSNNFQPTAHDQILSCISEATKTFEAAYPDKKSDITAFFSIWEQLFNELTCDTSSDATDNTFQWSVHYPFFPCTLTAAFNIDAIRNDHQALTKTTRNKINFDNIITSPSNQPTAKDTNRTDAILICDSLSGPILLDNPHHYQNTLTQNPDTPVSIIPYMNLTKQHFINEFNFAVFLFTEEVSHCFKHFDNSTLMRSYLRIGNKFKL